MHGVDNSLESQVQLFADFWDKFSEQIMNGKGSTDYPTGSELQPHHYSTIIRLPPEIGRQLHQQLENVCMDDYHYPSSDLHLTLINLDKLLDKQRAVDWHKLSQYISTKTDQLPAFKFEVKGINVFPTTVFVEIYDTNGLLEVYRRAIVQGVSDYLSEDLNSNDYTALVPGITFVNMIRFKTTPKPAIIQDLKRYRKLDSGSFSPSEFEIVTTNRLLSLESTIINSVIPISQ